MITKIWYDANLSGKNMLISIVK